MIKLALAKDGYSNAIKGTTSQKINLREDGTIAQDGDTIAGSKRISINTANASNSATTNQNIFRAFLDFVGNGSTDTLTNKFQVSWEI